MDLEAMLNVCFTTARKRIRLMDLEPVFKACFIMARIRIRLKNDNAFEFKFQLKLYSENSELRNIVLTGQTLLSEGSL